MAKIKLRKRAAENIKIQVHMKLPVPPGYSLAPELVTQIINSWCDGDTPEAGTVTQVDWNFDDRRTGKVTGGDGSEVDSGGSLRDALINRFRFGAVQATSRSMGPRENVERGNDDFENFDD